jgi:hypothetical protein
LSVIFNPVLGYASGPQDAEEGDARHGVPEEKGGAHVSTFNVRFSDQTQQVLDDLSRRLGTSLADVMWEALSLYCWVSRERAAGNHLLIDREGTISEFTVPSLERLVQEAAPITSSDSD